MLLSGWLTMKGERRHRCVGGAEHNGEQSLYHGCCAICLEGWPCLHEQALQAAELASASLPPGVYLSMAQVEQVRYDRDQAEAKMEELVKALGLDGGNYWRGRSDALSSVLALLDGVKEEK